VTWSSTIQTECMVVFPLLRRSDGRAYMLPCKYTVLL